MTSPTLAPDPELDGFLALLATRRAPRTVDAYRRDLAQLSAWRKGPVGETTTEELERWLAELRAAGLAASTVARRIAALRSFFRHQMLLGARDDNPAAAHADGIEQDGRLVVMDMRHVRVPRLENRGGNIKRHARLFAASQPLQQNKSCARPFNMLTVNANGQVVLCCADLYSDVVMGDVTKDRLETIWNNGSFETYRTQLSERGRAGLPLCSDCSYEGSASTVRYPLPSTSQNPVESKLSWVRRGLKRVRDRARMRYRDNKS